MELIVICVSLLVAKAGPRAEVILGGVVCDFQERMAKSGSGKYAFFKLEDQHGQIEVQVGSAVKLPWADESMDVCLVIELLEHVA